MSPRTKRNIVIFITLGFLLVGAMLLAGCGSGANDYFGSQTDTAGEIYRDARVSSHDDEPAKIINMPNGFSNAAFKCNGTTGIYVTRNTNGRAIAAVANDGNCVGKP